MSAASDPVNRRDDACHLCGDVAVPGRVVAISADTRTATVALDCGTESTVNVALDLVEAELGDTLLVHLGFAIARLDAA